MLTAAGLAAQLGISERQVNRLVAAGLPRTPIGARGWRYDFIECRDWLRENPQCLSSEQKPAASRSVSASAANAFTAAYRRVQVRVKPSSSKPTSERLSAEAGNPLSLVTPQ